jgi:hypothetical protein
MHIIIFTCVKLTENGKYSYNFTSKSVLLPLFPGFLAFYTKNIQIFQLIVYKNCAHAHNSKSPISMLKNVIFVLHKVVLSR